MKEGVFWLDACRYLVGIASAGAVAAPPGQLQEAAVRQIRAADGAATLDTLSGPGGPTYGHRAIHVVSNSRASTGWGDASTEAASRDEQQ
jgi:hypothetical protein